MTDQERRELRPGDVVFVEGFGEGVVTEAMWKDFVRGELIAVGLGDCPLSKVSTLLYRTATREEWTAMIRKQNFLLSLLEDSLPGLTAAQDHALVNTTDLLYRIRVALSEGAK